MTAVVQRQVRRRSATRGRILPRQNPNRSRSRQDAITGWTMITPTVLLIGLFGVVPLVWSFVLSLQRNDLQTTPKWVGGQNYDTLVHDPVFWQAARQTLVYTVLFVPITLLFSLLVAAALNRRVRGMSVYRLAVFVPVVTSTVATGVIFTWLLDPQFGLVNGLLGRLGIPKQGFFSSPHEALYTIVGMTVWGWVGFGALIYLAALQGVPGDLIESALTDGCTRRQAFWRIQVPLLRPVTGFLTVWLTINGLQLFDEVYVTTKGGPLHASTVLVYYLYQQTFSFFRAGYAAAIATVLFVVIVAVSAVQLRLSRTSDEEPTR